MGGVIDKTKAHHAREGPSRGLHRDNKTGQIRFQQTRCKKHRVNGSLWPSRDIRLQYEQIGKNDLEKKKRIEDEKRIEDKMKEKLEIQQATTQIR